MSSRNHTDVGTHWGWWYQWHRLVEQRAQTFKDWYASEVWIIGGALWIGQKSPKKNMICVRVKSGCNIPLYLTYRQSSESAHCLLQHPDGLLRVKQVCESVLSPDEVFQPVNPYSNMKSASSATHSLIESSLTVKAIACKMYSAALPRNVASCDNEDAGEKNSWTISHRSRIEGGFPCSSDVNSGTVKEGRNRERVARISSRPESAMIYRIA